MHKRLMLVLIWFLMCSLKPGCFFSQDKAIVKFKERLAHESHRKYEKLFEQTRIALAFYEKAEDNKPSREKILEPKKALWKKIKRTERKLQRTTECLEILKKTYTQIHMFGVVPQDFREVSHSLKSIIEQLTAQAKDLQIKLYDMYALEIICFPRPIIKKNKHTPAGLFDEKNPLL